jgi:uncharacterized protein with HEPN domain
VTKCLESIAEASKNLPPAFKARHPHIAWKQIAAFRDFSAHHYWDIVGSHLPQLLAVVREEPSRIRRPPDKKP